MPAKSHHPSVKFATYGRCPYTTRANRRCRSLLLDPDARFCPRHAYLRSTPDDYHVILSNRAHRFRCAHGINNSLADLYAHVAGGAISPRRASTLAYITSLLLRTLPAIEKEPSFACYRPVHPRNLPVSTDEPGDSPTATLSNAKLIAGNYSHNMCDLITESVVPLITSDFSGGESMGADGVDTRNYSVTVAPSTRM
jgi:hypothetical protein